MKVRPGRSSWRVVAPLLLLFAGTFSFAFLDVTLSSVESSLDAYYSETRFADYRAGGGDADAFADAARRLDGVAAVSERTTVTLAVWARDGKQKVQGQLVGVPQVPPEVDGYLVDEGRGLDPEQPTDVVVDSHTASGLGLAPGDSVRILGLGAVEDVALRGVVSSPEYVVPAANAQQLVTAPGQFAVAFAPESFVAQTAGTAGTREVLVRYEPGASRARLDDRLDALAARTAASVREPRAEQPSNAMVQAELDGLGVARLLAPGLLLVLAVVVGGLALALAARAGAPRGHVLIGGLVATDLGILIGILVAVAVAGSITDQLDIPITEISISVGGIVVAAVLGAVAVLLSVGMARATEAPRHPTAVGVALAGAGAALAVAAVLAPLGIVDAAEATLARAARLEVVDAQIAFQVPVGDEQIAQLGDIGGVAVAEPLPSAVVELARGPNGYATQIEAFERGSELARFETPGGEVQALPEDGLLVPGPLADILHAEPGDAIDVTLPGVGTFSMSMAARTSDALGNLVFTSIPGLREAMNAQPGDFAGGLFNVAATRFEPGADSVRIAREITKEPTVATYVDVAVDLDSFVGALPLLRVVSWTLLGIGAAIAVLAALVAALAIAPGARFRDLLFELVLPGIVGAGLGILIGAGAADRLVDALETPVVHLQEGLDASSVLVAVGVVVLVDLVVAGWTTWSARRHAATMDGHG